MLPHRLFILVTLALSFAANPCLAQDCIKDLSSALTEHRALKLPKPESQELKFSGIRGRDAYNPTKPFLFNGTKIIAARVESREIETDSEVMFLRESHGRWSPVPGAPVFKKMQDPFFTFVAGELIVGGVEICAEECGTNDIRYRTVFYSGKTLGTLKRTFEGPWGMKGIRLKELTDGRILVLTRPQGQTGGRGKIGHVIISSLAALNHEVILGAELFPGQFNENEWGGANEIHLLGANLAGVLGHIAKFDEHGNRDYYAMTFTMNLSTGAASPIKIILERSSLFNGTMGRAKRPDLVNVIYPGGLEILADGTAIITVGDGDALIHSARIPAPF